MDELNVIIDEQTVNDGGAFAKRLMFLLMQYAEQHPEVLKQENELEETT